MTPEQIAAAEAAANIEIAAAIDVLCKVPTKSTAHMDEQERRDGLGVMLADLFTLARRDGCIAAAWAYEFACEMARKLDATRDDGAAVDEAWLDEVFDVRSRYQVTAFSSCWRLGDYRGNNHKLQIRLHRDSDTGRIGYCRLETRDGVSVCDISIRDQVRSLLKGININISAGA
jgi:hypothetical protein